MTVDLITLKDPRSPASDAYRTLRTNLLFSNLDQQVITIGVTAPAQDNHKSVATANLAVTLAQSGRRTVLVDADLRRPEQHTVWGLPNERGLTTMVLENSALENPPVNETEVENLWVLTSGPLPPNPVDVLASVRMDNVIQQLMKSADFLVFEMPPVLVAADALVLGQKLGGALLVVQANKSRRDHATRAKLQLERVGVRLLGAVLLDAKPDRTSMSYR
ncbi:MAG: tyrosine protein kinase [Chloroflexota bacterium]|nr:polysaccharide biosynthesis tyrosine autokinase [Chloroflexota bacterium]NOG65091.1 CpsD/CapB family tyrosine-protein kinase [Chloroflexota bacterium]GIK65282.1 MAG: tyrosine protein kinase [Chloroflexota bacterium]